MRKGWRKKTKKIDELLNELSNLLTLLIDRDASEFTYDRCRLILKSAIQLGRLTLRNNRMRGRF